MRSGLGVTASNWRTHLAAAGLALCATMPWAPAVHAAANLPALKVDLNGEPASVDVRELAQWAVESGDPQGQPFVIVDKRDARVFVFDAQGHLRGSSPALVGAARGDESVPGIGQRPIASIRPDERTTPAGRFTASMGRGPNGEDILWVDYDAAIALHRVVTHVPAERRLERLQSKLASDRRITYGCINVPVAFYESVVRPTFSDTRGIVYILPESRRPQDLFAGLAHAPEMTRTAAPASR